MKYMWKNWNGIAKKLRNFLFVEHGKYIKLIHLSNMKHIIYNIESCSCENKTAKKKQESYWICKLYYVSSYNQHVSDGHNKTDFVSRKWKHLHIRSQSASLHDFLFGNFQIWKPSISKWITNVFYSFLSWFLCRLLFHLFHFFSFMF